MDTETWFLVGFLICFNLFIVWASWPQPKPKPVPVKKKNPFSVVRKDR